MYGKRGNLWGSPSIIAPRMAPSRVAPRFPCYVDPLSPNLQKENDPRLGKWA